MSRLSWAASAVALLLVGTGAALGAPASAAVTAYSWGGVGTWPANRTVGTDSYDRGVWSYTNRWGKATGANADGKHREDYYAGLPEAAALTYDAFGAHRTARNGDYYPPNDDSRFPELSANVVFVQLHPSAAGLDVRVVLNSLGSRDSSILTLALATGRSTATSTLPRNARLQCTSCGVEQYVTVWGAGSEITDASGAKKGRVRYLAVDRAENTITFQVPGIRAGGGSLRAWLASGLNDGTGRYLTVQPFQSSTAPGGGRGGTNVFDLAFVHDDRRTVDERVQSDLLSHGEIGPAMAVVDLAALQAGTRRVKGEPRSGPVEKVLVSASRQGEGIDTGNGPGAFQNPGAGQNFHYLGRTQGYLVDLPPGYRPGVPVPEVMVLHGYNGYYDEEYFLAPKMRAAIEKLGYIGVYPLGRGDVQYEHDGELDLLEVQRAVEHDYAIDRDRVHLVGISMGGFGATKAAVRHPDVFADASVFVGGEQGDANVVNDRLVNYPLTRAVDTQVVANLQDTPLLLGASAADADAAGASASVVYDQLRQLGDEAHLKQYLAGTHEPAIIDLAVKQMVPVWQRSRRPAVPARVHYAFDTSWDFGPLVDSGSAWLQHLRVASGTQATASAEALTVARPLTALTETTTTGGAVTDRSAYLLRDSLRHRTRNRPVSNALSVSLTNVAASSVDLGPLRVDTGRRYCIDVTSDTSSTVALTGRNLSRLAVAGVTATRRGSGLLLRVSPGTTHAVLTPQGVAAAVGTACPAAAGTGSSVDRADARSGVDRADARSGVDRADARSGVDRASAARAGTDSGRPASAAGRSGSSLAATGLSTAPALVGAALVLLVAGAVRHRKGR